METILFYFSPTHTGQKTARAIARGLGFETKEVDVTLPQQRKAFMAAVPAIPEDAVVLLESPVYGGHLNGVARQMLSQLKGNGQPAILLTLYGNRHYDEANKELYDLAKAAGFRPVACGSFIGEHSFSDKIATGRPNEQDLAEAEAFGKSIGAKLAGSWSELTAEQIPFNARNDNPSAKAAALPKEAIGPHVDEEKCIGCGSCVQACPMGNLVLNTEKGKAENTHTACLRCRACARVCPVQGIDFVGEEWQKVVQRCFMGFGSPARENVTVL